MKVCFTAKNLRFNVIVQRKGKWSKKQMFLYIIHGGNWIRDLTSAAPCSTHVHSRWISGPQPPQHLVNGRGGASTVPDIDSGPQRDGPLSAEMRNCAAEGWRGGGQSHTSWYQSKARIASALMWTSPPIVRVSLDLGRGGDSHTHSHFHWWHTASQTGGISLWPRLVRLGRTRVRFHSWFGSAGIQSCTRASFSKCSVC